MILLSSPGVAALASHSRSGRSVSEGSIDMRFKKEWQDEAAWVGVGGGVCGCDGRS